jgi:hypothetical protein
MDNREYPKVRAEAVRQGWVVRPTRRGELFLSPDGRTAIAWHAAHRSSDPHALDSLVRALRRTGGFQWPPPGREGRAAGGR